MRCPRCHTFAIREAGGIRCLTRGCWVPFLRTLPRDHCSGQGGWDWRARVRQSAVDAMYRHPARAVDTMQTMLERLEGRPKDAAPSSVGRAQAGAADGPPPGVCGP